MQGRCRVWPRLSEFSGVVLSCFTISSSTVFTDVSLIKPEDSFNPFFKAILYLVSGARERAQELCESRGGRPGLPVSRFGLAVRR